MARRTFKKQTSSKKSILISLLVVLVLFVGAGFLIISYFDEFYHKEKMHEAMLLAQTYANTLEASLDARSLLTEQFHTTLRVAGEVLAMQDQPLSNEKLAILAKKLNVDVFYLYDKDGRVLHSSDNLYIGWIAPEGHPVREFLQSGLAHSVDEIRTDSETDTYWMYSYLRCEDGLMIQSGILADKLAELYAHLNEQWIIDQIAHESPLTQISFINPQHIITASSVPQEIGQSVDEAELRRFLKEGPTHLAFDGVELDWHLKIYTPIEVDGVRLGTLAMMFDLSNTNKLFVKIELTVTSVLIIIFIVFSLFIINIANKNKHIFTIAYFDEVTELPNVRYLKQVLKEQQQGETALIIINPLHFKFINLIYGYNYGDRLLRQIGQNLEGISCKGISLQAYRFTDDQFIITAKEYASEEALHAVCRQILTINEKPGVLGSVDLTLGVVAGQKAFDFETIIKKASIALSAANKDNRIQFYTEAIEEQILRQDSIETELKRVIAGEEGILSLAYQPIVKAEDSSIRSFEALARMQSSTLGRVPPLEFIAIAEERHLIIPLGKVIMEQVALFIQRLTDLGHTSTPIAVNVSALQLLDEAFVGTLKHITQKTGIKTEQLEIELTESVFSSNIEFLSSQLEQIHAMGIHVAIDDFGTGFSSLNRLEGLGVDTLKLDKQFVDKLVDAETTGISSDIISMAHHLGKKVIAEGVETEEQRQILLGMECDYMQGYLFSRPVGEAEVIALLKGDS